MKHIRIYIYIEAINFDGACRGSYGTSVWLRSGHAWEVSPLRLQRHAGTFFKWKDFSHNIAIGTLRENCRLSDRWEAWHSPRQLCCGGAHQKSVRYNSSVWLLDTQRSRDTTQFTLQWCHKQRVLMHRHQGWNVRHDLCHIYMRYSDIYELFIAFVCFVVCSLL